MLFSENSTTQDDEQTSFTLLALETEKESGWLIGFRRLTGIN
jgi:hypothetical protein